MKVDNAMAESSVLNVSEEKTNGTRLARLLIDGGTHALRKYFDHIHPPEKLENALNNNNGKLEDLRKKRVIVKSQWQKLFPSSGDPPDSRTFDITLLHLLLREICHLTAPSTGWHSMPADDDISPEASIAKIKCFRNELCHSISTGVSNEEFESTWDNIASSLVALGLDQREVDRLKTDPIDHDTQRRVEEEVQRLDSDYKAELRSVKRDVQELQGHFASIQDSISKPCTPALSSCLPDEQPHVFGRSAEINQVTEAVQSEAVSVVLITGGPGFGKTTVAKEVARALEEKKRDEKAVLFCSIRSKPTLNDVATEMILVCSNSIGQPPEYPKLWLLNWSKQRLNVVFILDNADDVLHSDERNAFTSLLGQMRSLSGQNVKFVITTRTAFEDPNLQTREVRLPCLSREDARKVLVSRVQSQEGHKLSKADILVELCGCVPLALCIAGSVLPDYTEDELIARLESDPLDVLQDDLRPSDQKSVDNAIKASLNVLNESEQTGIVLMTVFPGSFNADAAKAVLGAFPQLKVTPERILRSLRNRSLVEYVEQPSSQRYQIHLLVQACVDKIARAKYPQLLTMGKKLVCSHFISCFSELTKLYWGKDTSKQAFESFNEDRHNFEYFLTILVHGMEDQDPADILATTKSFLDNLPQKCMFLEMCILPGVYSELLESLSNSRVSENQPVHKVELLCLLWHETRKVRGYQEENKQYMEEAKRLHSENSKEFETKAAALSEVLFRTSYAQLLSLQKDQNGSKEQHDIALNVCKDKLGEDHPETAATLLFSGRQAKFRDVRDEAEIKLKEALEIFKRSLGRHFMTAQGLKDLADFYLFSGETEPDLDKSLEYYEEALQMMKEVGLDNHKECILTLKNFGVCHRKKGSCYEEAKKLLQRADEIAQRELKEDHKWKVMVKTQQALLHNKMGNEVVAQELMKEGLKIWQKIKDPRDWLGNKDEVLKFRDRYPEIFPEEEFPLSLFC